MPKSTRRAHPLGPGAAREVQQDWENAVNEIHRLEDLILLDTEVLRTTSTDGFGAPIEHGNRAGQAPAQRPSSRRPLPEGQPDPDTPLPEHPARRPCAAKRRDRRLNAPYTPEDVRASAS